MAQVKIDTSKIKGYAEMTAEEKIKALETVTFDDGTSEIDRYKNAVSKASSEAAEWKKKYNATLDEGTKQQNATQELIETLQAKVTQLEAEKNIADNKAKFLALGYSDELADSTAQAMASNDLDTIFANQKTFLASREQSIKDELLKNTPKPDVNTNSQQKITAEQFEKMSFAERASLYESDNALYTELSNNN